MIKPIFTLILIGLFCFSFNRIAVRFFDDPVPIPPSPQRMGGDINKGYQYLTTGDYLKSGVPYNLFLYSIGKNKKIYLEREGFNKKLPHEYTAIKSGNGEMLVAPNCLQCHAQIFNDHLYVGLGNSLIDFSNNQKLDTNRLAMLETFLKKSFPQQYEAAANFITVSKTVGPFLNTDVRGVNSADRLAAVLAAHRDPLTFEWNDKAHLDIPDYVVPTDVPAWWLLKKKNAMFYNGFGRGDFGKFLMASNLFTVHDTAESREVDSHMPDVLAYIYSLEPPKFPGPIDRSLASEGAIVFVQHCSKCHGKYGDNPEYPNLLIPESTIKTDSLLYKSNYSNPQFVNWFNHSWFTTSEHPARIEPFEGYIAPPLDGIWITAPYFHNGSVPTLEGVLNSRARPKFWSRNFDSTEYDYEKVGWQFKSLKAPCGTTVYNTTLRGYGNYGHYFGDRLTEKERKAVIEYLKTL